MICLKPSSWLASQKVDKNVQLHGRSPYGERGLKFVGPGVLRAADESLSLRRAWIEIGRSFVPSFSQSWSLSLRRAWIEIANRSTNASAWTCRSPYGERGLKLREWINSNFAAMSLSLRRAWIEMNMGVKKGMVNKSLSLRRAWIEITHPLDPSRGISRRSPYGERGLKCFRV